MATGYIQGDPKNTSYGHLIPSEDVIRKIKLNSSGIESIRMVLISDILEILKVQEGQAININNFSIQVGLNLNVEPFVCQALLGSFKVICALRHQYSEGKGQIE